MSSKTTYENLKALEDKLNQNPNSSFNNRDDLSNDGVDACKTVAASTAVVGLGIIGSAINLGLYSVIVLLNFILRTWMVFGAGGLIVFTTLFFNLSSLNPVKNKEVNTQIKSTPNINSPTITPSTTIFDDGKHNVRGHWRTLPSGEEVWVRPHVRSDPN